MSIIEKNNRWTFIKRISGGKAICRCDCGKEKEIYFHHYKSGASKSCGCLQKEISIKVHTTHGNSYSTLYNVWKGIKQRCTNKNSKDYKNYGLRGISIEWENYEEFEKDMLYGYNIHFKENNGDTTIERIEVNGNYCKKNCCWATRKEQANNKR